MQSAPRSTAPSGGATTTQQRTAPRTTTTLVLRADHAEVRHIQWAEDVIDNEDMGKKSSKVCCIYHKPHAVDESSGDESSSDSSSDSDSGDDGAARRVGGDRRGRRHNHPHQHDHGDGGAGPGQGGDSGKGKGKGKGKIRKRSPNAYEKMPGPAKKKD